MKPERMDSTFIVPNNSLHHKVGKINCDGWTVVECERFNSHSTIFKALYVGSYVKNHVVDQDKIINNYWNHLSRNDKI